MNEVEARAWTEDWMRRHPARAPERVEVVRPTMNLATVRDGRGGIWTYLPAEPIVEYNLIVSKSGAMRGMHWHPCFTEYLLVVSGSGARRLVSLVQVVPGAGEGQ